MINASQEYFRSKKSEKERLERLTQYHICVLRLFFEQLGRVKIAIDKPNFRVLGYDRSTFFTATNDARDFILGMSIYYGVECITTDVACSTGTIRNLAHCPIG